ncbi:hypothetical protein SynWH8101_1092 [Synechococcus sp. WH 8101]|nr:hypothetical protein SynWH8101_1092 [Synechococcus sp. WH 8101]
MGKRSISKRHVTSQEINRRIDTLDTILLLEIICINDAAFRCEFI